MNIVHVYPTIKGSTTNIASAAIKASGSCSHVKIKRPYIKNICELILFNFKKIDIIHTHTTVASILVALFCMKGKIIIMLHDQGMEYFRLYMNPCRRVIMAVLRYIVFIRANVIITVSKSIAKNYSNKVNRKVIVFYNYVDILLTNTNYKYNIKNKSIAIIANHRYYVKGIDKVLEFSKEDNSFKYCIYGITKKEAEKYYNSDNANKDIPCNVTFKGHVAKKKMFLEINKMNSIVAVFSRTEGFHLGAIETAALGMPLIVNDLHIFDELYPRNLFPRFNINDIQSFQDAYKSISKVDHQTREKFGKIVRLKYSESKYIIKMSQLYNSLQNNIT